MDDRADELVPILRVENAEIAAQWYSRLGFALQGVHRFEPGFPAYAFLKRDATHIHLSEHRGDAPRRGVVYWYVDRGMIDVFAAEFGVTIERQPWCDEIHLTDPDGNRLRVGCRNEEDDPGFAPTTTVLFSADSAADVTAADITAETTMTTQIDGTLSHSTLTVPVGQVFGIVPAEGADLDAVKIGCADAQTLLPGSAAGFVITTPGTSTISLDIAGTELGTIIAE